MRRADGQARVSSEVSPRNNPTVVHPAPTEQQPSQRLSSEQAAQLRSQSQHKTPHLPSQAGASGFVRSFIPQMNVSALDGSMAGSEDSTASASWLGQNMSPVTVPELLRTLTVEQLMQAQQTITQQLTSRGHRPSETEHRTSAADQVLISSDDSSQELQQHDSNLPVSASTPRGTLGTSGGKLINVSGQSTTERTQSLQSVTGRATLPHPFSGKQTTAQGGAEQSSGRANKGHRGGSAASKSLGLGFRF